MADFIEKSVPLIRCRPEIELLNHLLADTSLLDYLAGRCSKLRIAEHRTEVILGVGIGLAEIGTAGSVRFGAIVPFLLKRDTGSLGQKLQGFEKVHTMIFLHEGKGISRFAACVALVKGVSLMGDDGKGRSVVLMKRTQSHIRILRLANAE